MNISSEVISSNQASTQVVKRIYEITNYAFEGEYENEIRKQLEYNGTQIILVKEDNYIIGFHLFSITESKLHPGLVRGVCAGDLALESKSKLVGNFFISTVISEIFNNQVQQNGQKWYWFVPLAGPHLYSIFYAVFKKLYPSPQVDFPSYEKSLLDDFAKQYYGKYYDPESLLIGYPLSYYLRKNAKSDAKSDVKNLINEFYNTKNPYANEGKDLACITELNRSNLTEQGLRLIIRRRRNDGK
jgi:hypothetical protein